MMVTMVNQVEAELFLMTGEEAFTFTDPQLSLSLILMIQVEAELILMTGEEAFTFTFTDPHDPG